MAFREIPVSYEFICDVCHCGVEKSSSGRPKHWSELHFIQDAYDYSDHAVADGSVKRLLCPKCSKSLQTAINECAKKLSRPSSEKTPS